MNSKEQEKEATEQQQRRRRREDHDDYDDDRKDDDDDYGGETVLIPALLVVSMRIPLIILREVETKRRGNIEAHSCSLCWPGNNKNKSVLKRWTEHLSKWCLVCPGIQPKWVL